MHNFLHFLEEIYSKGGDFTPFVKYCTDVHLKLKEIHVKKCNAFIELSLGLYGCETSRLPIFFIKAAHIMAVRSSLRAGYCLPSGRFLILICIGG
jgi:hypothetical protein